MHWLASRTSQEMLPPSLFCLQGCTTSDGLKWCWIFFYHSSHLHYVRPKIAWLELVSSVFNSDTRSHRFSCLAPFLLSYHLMLRGRKTTIWIFCTVCFCRWPESNPVRLRGKQVGYPLLLYLLNQMALEMIQNNFFLSKARIFWDSWMHNFLRVIVWILTAARRLRNHQKIDLSKIKKMNTSLIADTN